MTTTRPTIRFVPLADTLRPTVALLVADGGGLGSIANKLDGKSSGAIRRAMAAAEFKGKARAAIEVLGAPDIEPSRVVLLGLGSEENWTELDRVRLGGAVFTQITQRKTEAASIVVEHKDRDTATRLAAEIAQGAVLRAYQFRRYRTRSTENGEMKDASLPAIYIHCADPDAAEETFSALSAVADGVYLARDLVNEPANMLGPVEFAERLNSLDVPDLKVEVLDMADLKQLGMGALLAVGQGSARESRVVVMQWHGAKGGKRRKPPLCFVGKGVVFDTGGISMKPAAGMEDMKGDMGGAACVSGLMLALAKRKAPVDAIGLVGLVENMPSGTATRPGDIVTSMSGQTIEILNTDAEGRLVLADVLWYAQDRFEPRMIVDLATLTGAIMVALGKEHAGLFSNNKDLIRDLQKAGEETGEKVWPMPLGEAYDKLIDSKNADIKNIGGRYGGAITAAQFLQRFIKRGGKDGPTPWAHLDVAGTAMDSNRNEINQSWGSGWGVRLLNRLVEENYE